MMKLLLCSISAVVLSLCVNGSVLAADENAQQAVTQQTQASSGKRFGGTYSAKPLKADPVAVPVAKTTEYEEMITEAVVLHNFLTLIDEQIAQAKEFDYIVKDKELDKARLADFEACQVKSLSNYFKNPDKVWATLKAQAEEKLQEYNASTVELSAQLEEKVASMVALTDDERIALLEAEKNKSHDDDPDTFEQDFIDTNAEWKIGYTILNSFYANKDDWAERKTTTTSSLPLWQDQKYLYNKTIWTPKYAEIAEYCAAQGVKLASAEPAIKDEYKYDYYFYDKVQDAHKRFVGQATAQGCIVTPKMKEAPQVAPRPLPPVEEQILVVERPVQGMKTKAPHDSVFEKQDIPVVTEDSEVICGIYPQTPKNPNPDKKGTFLDDTLWDVYKNENFANVFDDGEFRSYFSSSLEVSDKAREANDNRISKYFSLKTSIDMSQHAYENFLENRDEMAATFDTLADEYGVKVPENMNYLNVSDLQKLRDAIDARKQELIKQAKASMGTEADTSNLTAEQLQEDSYKAMLSAMQADDKGIVVLTRDTAVAIDDSLKEAQAEKALTATYASAVDKLKKDMLNEKNHKTTQGNCLTFEGPVLLDLDKIKVE